MFIQSEMFFVLIILVFNPGVWAAADYACSEYVKYNLVSNDLVSTISVPYSGELNITLKLYVTFASDSTSSVKAKLLSIDNDSKTAVFQVIFDKPHARPEIKKIFFNDIALCDTKVNSDDNSIWVNISNYVDKPVSLRGYSNRLFNPAVTSWKNEVPIGGTNLGEVKDRLNEMISKLASSLDIPQSNFPQRNQFRRPQGSVEEDFSHDASSDNNRLPPDGRVVKGPNGNFNNNYDRENPQQNMDDNALLNNIKQLMKNVPGGMDLFDFSERPALTTIRPFRNKPDWGEEKPVEQIYDDYEDDPKLKKVIDKVFGINKNNNPDEENISITFPLSTDFHINVPRGWKLKLVRDDEESPEPPAYPNYQEKYPSSRFPHYPPNYPYTSPPHYPPIYPL